MVRHSLRCALFTHTEFDIAVYCIHDHKPLLSSQISTMWLNSKSEAAYCNIIIKHQGLYLVCFSLRYRYLVTKGVFSIKWPLIIWAMPWHFLRTFVLKRYKGRRRKNNLPSSIKHFSYSLQYDFWKQKERLTPSCLC